MSTNCPRFGSVNDILSKISRDWVRPRRSISATRSLNSRVNTRHVNAGVARLKEPGSGLSIWRRATLRTPICPWANGPGFTSRDACDPVRCPPPMPCEFSASRRKCASDAMQLIGAFRIGSTAEGRLWWHAQCRSEGKAAWLSSTTLSVWVHSFHKRIPFSLRVYSDPHMDFGVSDDCCRLINEGQDLTDLFKRFIVPVVGWWWFYAMAFCLMLFSAEAMTGRQALRLDDSAIFECRTILSQLGFWQIPAERFNLGITLV